MTTKEERAAYLKAAPGLKRAMEEEWRPLWKGMGVARVAADLATGGPAVRAGGGGGNDWIKANEARVWMEEENGKIERAERTTRWRANASLFISAAALIVAIFAILWRQG